jgi:hypothetical protein
MQPDASKSGIIRMGKWPPELDAERLLGRVASSPCSGGMFEGVAEAAACFRRVLRTRGWKWVKCRVTGVYWGRWLRATMGGWLS